MMQEKKKKELYVGIKDPRELRRNILEASKSAIMTLHTNQRLKQIQIQKNILKSRLKKDVKELKMLFLHLEKIIPEHEAKEEKPAPKVEIKAPPIKTDDQEVDKLHRHLNIIEERLKKLEQ